MADDTRQTKDALLKALLPDVPFDGWTTVAMRKAAEQAGIDPAEAASLFPGGPRDAVAWFSRWADREAMASLASLDLTAMKMGERIAAAVRARLTVLAPHREAVRRSMALLAAPQNMFLGARLLYETVDALWYAAGDTATDFNFYTKRGLLAGVYAATTLYWLDDRSENQVDTVAFLERRLADVLATSRVGERLRSWGMRFPNPFLLARLARRR
ncbi:MAG TPA: COQ9 family protein [Stellaceae bacterium]|nr:COQ9 family protein [Stellaceae bacterium]